MRRAPIVILLLAACGGGGPALLTDEPLAIRRVVLFQNGLAYVERRGRTTEGAIDLVVRSEHLDDVLKSLTVVDSGGGGVSSVRVLPHPEDAPTVTLRVGLREAEQHELRVSYVTEAS